MSEYKFIETTSGEFFRVEDLRSFKKHECKDLFGNPQVNYYVKIENEHGEYDVYDIAKNTFERLLTLGVA